MNLRRAPAGCGDKENFAVFTDDACNPVLLRQGFDEPVHLPGVLVGDVLPQAHLKLAPAERVLTQVLDLNKRFVLNGSLFIGTVQSLDDPAAVRASLSSSEGRSPLACPRAKPGTR